MFNNKKIEALKEQLDKTINEFELLKNATQNITNFDELYNKILESYNNSKSLINEQLLQYDKKIIENTAIVDERLLSFHNKLENVLDNTIDELRKSILEKSLEMKKEITTLEDKVRKDLLEQGLEIKKEITSFDEEVRSNVDDYIKMSNIKLEKSLNANNDKINNSLKTEIEKISKTFNDLIEQYKKVYNENYIKHTNDINNKLNTYELNLNEMINSVITKQLNTLIVDDIANKSTELILNAFNKSLIELGEKEKNSIIEAIKTLVSPKLPVKMNKEEKVEIKELKKDELFHNNYNKLKLCVKSGIIPMIVGPAGTGKSTAAEQLSRDLGVDFYMANRIQNTFELVGFVNAAGEYVTTQFYEAYTKGGIFLFDEVDASSPEALVTINAAIAQGYMAFPGHPTALPMHENFKAICAGNTFGTGSTLQYTGRNKLDAATLDRFMIIEWDYDKVLEDKIIKDKNLLSICWALRVASPGIDKSIIISTRGIITLEKMLDANKEINAFSIKDLFRQKFFENVSKANIKKIYNAINDECKENIYLKYIGELSE